MYSPSRAAPLTATPMYFFRSPFSVIVIPVCGAGNVDRSRPFFPVALSSGLLQQSRRSDVPRGW